MLRFVCAICAWFFMVSACAADTARNGLFDPRQPLFTTQDADRSNITLASLFIGDAEGGFFSALPGRLDAPLRRGGVKAALLRDLIASVEAGRAGYDAVQHGARKKPDKRPTDMTLQDIYDWIKATPGQPHAIGRYQFIPATLRHSADRLGIPASARFSPAVQDQLADLLLGDAGLMKVQRGDISQEAFMLNLAKIWAGLPTASGRSYYHGVAGNKAVLDYDTYARQMSGILGG
ncbi:MAG: hypothetical protein AAFN80_13920 [Pseudomonadota bacterium]